jgi:hypothetical protein
VLYDKQMRVRQSAYGDPRKWRKKERKKDGGQGNGTHKDAQAVTKEYIVQVKYQGAQS